MDDEDMWVRLRWVSDEFKQGITEAKGQLTNWKDETNKNTVDMGKWSLALGTAAVSMTALSYATWKAAVNAGEFGNAIEENSRVLGMTTTQYQQWSHVAIAAGADANAFSEAVRMMSTRLKDAADPSTTLGKYMNALGVNVKDSAGNFRDMDSVLLDIIPAISALPDGFDKNQASLEIFGRSWSQIAPMLQLSREEIKALQEQAPVVDDDKIQKMAAFHTELALVNERWGVMYATLGTEVIPVIEEFLPLLEQYGVPALEALVEVLVQAGRGFHIMGAEAQAAYDLIINRDVEAAKNDLKELGSWIQATQTADALKASGYKEGDQWGGSKWMKQAAAATPASSGLKLPSDDNAEALKAAKKYQEDLTSATEKYVDSLKDVSAEMEDQSKLRRNYLEDMRFAGGDVSQMRSIKMNYNRAKRSEDEQLQDAYGRAQEAGTAMVAAGGTVEGDIWNVTVNASKDYPMSAVVNDLKTLQLSKSQRVQAGVRTP